ncbi:MAG TPA: hypothetical protein VKT73_02640 [Xanthobacteraceae bacterium]|nr:hypothetical protein [Xanthobacteraceae bacterium]
MHDGREYAGFYRRSGLTASAANLAHFEDLLFAQKPGRGFFGTVRDLVLLVLGWILLVGLIVYPVAHLIGIAVCAVALAVMPSERR